LCSNHAKTTICGDAAGGRRENCAERPILCHAGWGCVFDRNGEDREAAARKGGEAGVFESAGENGGRKKTAVGAPAGRGGVCAEPAGAAGGQSPGFEQDEQRGHELGVDDAQGESGAREGGVGQLDAEGKSEGGVPGGGAPRVRGQVGI